MSKKFIIIIASVILSIVFLYLVIDIATCTSYLFNNVPPFPQCLNASNFLLSGLYLPIVVALRDIPTHNQSFIGIGIIFLTVPEYLVIGLFASLIYKVLKKLTRII